VAGGFSFSSVGVGGAGACAFTDTGGTYCWGWNAYGQVGDGSTTNRPSPTAVLVLSAAVSQTVLTVDVLPELTFTVGNQATACNGESNFIASAGSGATVDLGHVALGTMASGGQQLSLTSNAVNGFTVYLRGTQSSGNLRSAGHNWGDVSGTYALPAAFGAGEEFGYTYADATASSSVTNPASATFVKLDTTDRAVMGSTSTSVGTACVSFAAQSSASTPAGTYGATVVYTAVPTF
jgi:hypothetical protein